MTRARQHPRYGPLLVRADFDHGDRREEGYLTNLSRGGAFLATETPPPVGSTLTLRITVPWGLGAAVVKAVVIWSRAPSRADGADRPSGVGLRFVELPPAAEEKLEAYLRRFHELAARLEERA